VSREFGKGWLSDPWKPCYTKRDLTSQEEATWLIVFDNADDPLKLIDYWPIQGGRSVLIISRDPLAKSAFSSEPCGLDLDALSDGEAASLLCKLTHDSNSNKFRSA